MGGKQRTHIHPFLDPKLAVESIGEVHRVHRAHLEVEFAQAIVRFSGLGRKVQVAKRRVPPRARTAAQHLWAANTLIYGI